MKKHAVSAKAHYIILAVILLSVFGIMLFGSKSMRITTEIEKPSFIIRMPRAFYEDEYGDFISSNNDMYITFSYYDNEIVLNTEGIALLYEAAFYEEGEVYSSQEIIINGVEAWQMEYSMMCSAVDETQNYYEGIFTIFPINNEFLIVDAYERIGDKNSDYSPITNKNMQILKDITSTIQLTNTTVDNTADESKELYASKLKLKLTSNWNLDENDDYGYFDYGYFVSYRFGKFRMWVDIYEYNEENINDMHEVLESRTKNSTYTSMGESFLAGERALLYSYNAYSVDGESPYDYGAIAISEHYVIDMYFYSYSNEYTLTYDTARNILNDILEVEYK